VYEYLEELDQMNWSARGNVLNQYLRNTSIGTTVRLGYISFFSVSQASFDAGLADLSGEEYDVHAVTGSHTILLPLCLGLGIT
jgi:hypothetical protein